MDEDYALALQLQSDLFQESELSKEDNSGSNNGKLVNAGEPLNLVDPYWELTDPNPDIRALFLQFNERFFWGRLAGIEIRWSPRMTLCAGLCCYEGRGGLCSVRLSVPLLRLRPRKDLVETLLHEMIHAYLFVTDNNKDHDGHGPEFHKHMYRINKEAGTSISVYHNFHDEVDACRQHWWRCDGPCRSRKPYFGYVKRSMNRAPSKNDTWWAEHQRSCGGTYTKVKEPEGYGKKKGKTESEDEKKKDSSVDKKKDKGKSAVKSMDIRIFGGDGKTLGGNMKDLISATKTAADVNSIPKPSTSQTVPVAQPVHTKPSREDYLPNKGFDRKKSDNKSSFKGNALPGGKTPKRDLNTRNKPVSQGGTAKFKEKKNLFHVTDFFDSDEDDELLASIPLDNLSGNSTGASRDSDNFSDTQGEINQSDKTVTNLSDVNDHLGASVTYTGTIQSGDKHSDKIKQFAEEKIEPGDSSAHNNQADDVRTMLRKVWGQKQFENKFSGSKSTKDIKKLPQNLFDSGEKFTDGKLRAGVSGYTTNTTHSGADRNSVISSNKRLSDTNSKISPPVKRRRSGDWKNFDSHALKNDEIVQPKPNVESSPIEKYFSKSQSVNLHAGNPKETSTSRGQSQNVNSSIIGDNLTETRPNGTEEKSTCPICNTLVVLSSINDHLDLCLTLQAIK